MKINTPSPFRVQHQAKPLNASPSGAEKSTIPSDSFSSGPNLGYIGMGLGTGVVGIGGTTALGMQAVKAFSNGSTLLGAGLTAATVAYGAVVGGTTLMAAAMSSGNGDTSGFTSYLVGGAAATVAAGVAIF